MALYKILKQFEQLDKRHGRVFNGPKATLTTIGIRQQSKNARPASAQPRRRTRHRATTASTSFSNHRHHRRPASAMARTRPKSTTTTTTFAAKKYTHQWSARHLTKGTQQNNEFDRKFYFLRITLEPKHVQAMVTVSATDLTDPDRPTHTYYDLKIHQQTRQIIFRQVPLANVPDVCISPVDDFDFVTSPAQMLGHTLRIRVSTSNQEVLVDTCCHFAGRNQGKSVVSSKRTPARTKHRGWLAHRKPSSGGGSKYSNETKQEPRHQTYGAKQQPRTALTHGTIQHSRVSLKEQINKAVDEGKTGEGKTSSAPAPAPLHRPPGTATTNPTTNELQNSSPNVKTRRVVVKKKQRRKKRGGVITNNTNNVDPYDILNPQNMHPKESPGTALRNIRSHLSLNIKKFKEEAEYKRNMVMKTALANVASGTPPRPSSKPSLTPYMKYNVDPDQLLRELAHVDTSAAADGLKGWSPKYSRTTARTNTIQSGVQGSKAFQDSKMSKK